jgi:phenylalanyl-tRNA synthetase alpha chain
MLSEGLHRIERRLLSLLAKAPTPLSVEQLAEASGLDQGAIRRAAEWLKEKGLIESLEREEQLVQLDSKGLEALQRGLPERRLYGLLAREGAMAVERARAELGEDFDAALGRALRSGWVSLRRARGGLLLQPSPQAPRAPEEELLERLGEGPLSLEALGEQERRLVQELLRRPRFLRIIRRTTTLLSPTQKGRELHERLGEQEWLDALTPEVLASGAWRGRALRPLDIYERPPRLLPGRKHPLTEMLEQVREAFLSMGFEEIDGPYIQPAFWNFDALFVPQDHPARELQDTFYIKGLRLPLEAREAVERVRRVHEDGGGTGSRGWGGIWRLEEAERALLRTHTTAVTVRYLWERKPERASAFIIDRVFRNEKVTFKAYVEFNQVEGIAVGRELNLRHLMGLLREFYRRIGIQEVRFWPTYFPYTEPSLQVMVRFERREEGPLWLEMGGAGIFRPEVTLPLGVKSRVLAWGLGLDRLAMLRQGIEDIRKLYEPDLRWLRERPCL